MNRYLKRHLKKEQIITNKRSQWGVHITKRENAQFKSMYTILCQSYDFVKCNIYKLIFIIDIYKRNMISRYFIGLSIEILNELCHASFVKHYQLLPKKIEKDSQPIELRDEIFEMNHPNTDQNTYPQFINLNTGERLANLNT